MTNSNRELSSLFLIKNHPNICNELHKRLGDPVDSYWNGSHTWFDEPEIWGDLRIEFRLHPVSNFVMPEASRPEELFELILEEKVDLTHYLEGLEVFPVDENALSVDQFNNYLYEKLGIEPDITGFVDHEQIGNTYEQSGGNISVVSALVEQLKN